MENIVHTTVLLTVFVASATALSAISCDCSSPITRGFIDIQDPSYCQTVDNKAERRKNVTYKVLGHLDSRTTWTGYYCSEWLNVKEINGAFWIGVFDTVFKKISRDVSPADCKRIVQEYKCAGNQVNRIGNTWSYTNEPAGEGKWNSLTVHSVTNCMAQQITLSATSADGPIQTPFGTINTTIHSRFYTLGHNTIVWDPPPTFSENVCKEKTLFTGKGNVTLTEGHGRLVDKLNQLEIHFDPAPLVVCETDVHRVVGLTDTFVQIREQGNGTRKRRGAGPGCTIKSTSGDSLCVSTGRMGQTAFLHRPLSMNELRTNRLPDGFTQRFDIVRDQTIRPTESDSCFHAESNSLIVLAECDEMSSRWNVSNRRVQEALTGKCLTRELSAIVLEDCESNFENQNWEIEVAVISADELAEFTGGPTIMFKDSKNRFFWGMIRLIGAHFQCITLWASNPRVIMRECQRTDDSQRMAFLTDLTLRINETNQS